MRGMTSLIAIGGLVVATEGLERGTPWLSRSLDRSDGRRTPTVAEALAAVRTEGLTSDPTAVSWGPGRIDVFARGPNADLWHKWWEGQWSGWESLGGSLARGADVASWGPGRLDVFARGSDQTLHHKWYDGKWSGWESLGGGLTSDPSAVSWGPGRLDVFARGADNGLWHIWWANAWSGWESLGGVLSSAPDAASWGSGRLDVFARGADNTLQHKWYAGQWSGWESLGGGLTLDPSAVSWGPGRIDVFSRGADYALWHIWYESDPTLLQRRQLSPPKWSGWESLGGPQSAFGIDASSWGSGRLDVFTVQGSNSALSHRWYSGGWSGWEDLGVPTSSGKPIISSLTPPGGTPPSTMTITGSGFGFDQGPNSAVHFAMNGLDVVAQRNGGWSDTQIGVLGPSFQRVLPGPVDVYVVNNGVRSNSQQYQYMPNIGTRVYCLESWPAGTTIGKPGGQIVATVWPSSAASVGCVPKGGVEHRNLDLAIGHKGSDSFFSGIRLSNGWVVENVILAIYHAQQAGAYVASFNKGSNDLLVNVGWWTDGSFIGLISNVAYTLAVVIKGPADLPDGWLVR
jgi:repeat uncharacterized protein DUF346/IPT/TIG domain-containing protein